jgi:hypothetical protein
MSTYDYNPGLGNVGSYQVSGVPYITGGVDCSAAATKIVFPSVTSWVSITNHGAELKIGFSKNGVDGTNYFRLHADSGNSHPPPARFELKVTEIWISGSVAVDICAGLTGISRNRIDNNTTSPDGTNWSGSAGALVG